MFRRFAYIIQKNLDLKRDFNDKKDITKEDLDSYIKQGAIIIDVRSPQEYQEGHLEGAILIPEYELVKRCEKELKDKKATIVVYCSSGSRSKRAQKKLEKLGYTKVYNLYNGFQNYWDFKVYMLK